jgi:hypothetical protein
MALEPVIGPFPLFQFRNPIHIQYDSLGGGSARRKAATYTHMTAQIQNKRTYNIHALSGIWTHGPSVRVGEDSSCLRRRGHRDTHDGYAKYIQIVNRRTEMEK